MSSNKPRDLNEHEAEEFDLYQTSENIRSLREPVWEGDDIIWTSIRVPGYTATYRFYTCGNNNLKILRYAPNVDKLEEIHAPHSYIDWYALLWKLVSELEVLKKEKSN